MATTIQEIAQELDLSVATVSRSLRHDPVIRPQTRARVNEAALKLGYRGRALSRPRSEEELKRHSLGVLLQIDSAPKRGGSEALMRILEGITAEADATEAVLNLHSIGYADRGKMAADAGTIPRMVRDQICSACIVQGTQALEDIATLAARLPLVTLSRVYPGVAAAAIVQDNMSGITRIVDRLSSLGHQRLAWVPESYAASFFEERRAGFLLGCQKNGLPFERQRLFSHDLYDDSQQLQGQMLVEAARDAKTTAFVCGSDRVALNVARVLIEAGFDIPRDISVTGFDAASAPLPNGRILTTVDPHFYTMGRLAVRLAIQCLDYPMEQAERRFIASTPVDGESVASPPSR